MGKLSASDFRQPFVAALNAGMAGAAGRRMCIARSTEAVRERLGDEKGALARCRWAETAEELRQALASFAAERNVSWLR